jgi:hypothetical protein
MMKIYFGTGDNPKLVEKMWLDRCDDGHPPVIFPTLATTVGGAIRGTCPACASKTVTKAANTSLLDDPLNRGDGSYKRGW